MGTTIRKGESSPEGRPSDRPRVIWRETSRSAATVSFLTVNIGGLESGCAIIGRINTAFHP
jgi:hypothetical protein